MVLDLIDNMENNKNSGDSNTIRPSIVSDDVSINVIKSPDHPTRTVTERVLEEPENSRVNILNTNQDISEQSDKERKPTDDSARKIDHTTNGKMNETDKQHNQNDNNQSGYDMVIPPDTLDNTPIAGSESSSGRQSVDSDTLQRVLEGWCTYKNLPPQSKKVVRIFVSSTFSGIFDIIKIKMPCKYGLNISCVYVSGILCKLGGKCCQMLKTFLFHFNEAT